MASTTDSDLSETVWIDGLEASDLFTLTIVVKPGDPVLGGRNIELVHQCTDPGLSAGVWYSGINIARVDQHAIAVPEKILIVGKHGASRESSVLDLGAANCPGDISAHMDGFFDSEVVQEFGGIDSVGAGRNELGHGCTLLTKDLIDGRGKQ